MLATQFLLAALVASVTATGQYFNSTDEAPSVVRKALERMAQDPDGPQADVAYGIRNDCKYPIHVYRHGDRVNFVKTLAPNEEFAEKYKGNNRTALNFYVASKDRGGYTKDGNTHMGVHHFGQDRYSITQQGHALRIYGEEEEQDSIVAAAQAMTCKKGGSLAFGAAGIEVYGKIKCPGKDNAIGLSAAAWIYAFCGYKRNYRFENGELMAGDEIVNWEM
ncbi:hypothetical protein VHEMI04179 [[Torrubiella] hemipterigena]|uniref:Ecp2 effector protein domain-containing protein n=1 Tax=[Torrubiella] hemipterigena TaxID=1531966 RepID=A0A0A1TFP5_9HYPO|nr:hypothetical protein VHEMI04179 [[Torrubiella] hemipterigena]